MITIFQKENKVIIKIESKYPVDGYNLSTDFTCPDSFYAKLTAENLADNLSETIEKIRKLEYESGWSDAKKKKKKRDYFYTNMTKNKY